MTFVRNADHADAISQLCGVLWDLFEHGTGSVEHVPAQRMVFGYARMIEIPSKIANHTDLLHHTPRRNIFRRSEGNDFLQAKVVVCKRKYHRRALGRQSPVPKACRQTPSDFNTGREMRLEGGHSESDKSSELIRLLQRHGPEPEAMLRKVTANPFKQHIRLLSRQYRWKVTPDPSISKHAREKCMIRFSQKPDQ